MPTVPSLKARDDIYDTLLKIAIILKRVERILESIVENDISLLKVKDKDISLSKSIAVLNPCSANSIPNIILFYFIEYSM